MSIVQQDILSVIEARRGLGLTDVFYTFLADCDIDFLISEGFDVIGTEEGYYIYF